MDSVDFKALQAIRLSLVAIRNSNSVPGHDGYLRDAGNALHQLDMMLERHRNPADQPDEKPEERTCEWEDLDGEMWKASCGLAWVMDNYDGLKANEMHFCPKCGKPIKEKPAPPSAEGGEG